MKIGILGSGVVGQQLGLGFLRIGHEVMIGTRNKGKLIDWLNQAGEKASASSVEETAKFGEVVILATAWSGTKDVINSAGKENLKNKLLIDVTNPLDSAQGPPPKLASSYGNSGGEQVQKWLPDTNVVKAFNIVNAYIMINPSRAEGDPDLFIAGNNDESKKRVTTFAEQLGWKSVIDIGDLSHAYWLETLAMLWIYYGFKTNTWAHAFKLLKK